MKRNGELRIKTLFHQSMKTPKLTNTSSDIPFAAMSGVIFSNDQSLTNLPNLQILKSKMSAPMYKI
jgi:hypothetical protein